MFTLRQAAARTAAATAAAALLLAGCSSSTDTTADSTDTTAAEASTETLVVYSGRDAELIDPLIEQFEQSSGISVDVRYAGTTELAAQLLEEGEDTPAHVFLSQDAGALGAVSAAGLFSTLPTEISDAVATEYTSRDGSWVGLTGRTRVVAYDSERLSADQVPGDIFAFTEPEWNGRVAIVPTNASFQAHVTAIRVLEGEDRAREWLEGLIANNAQIFARNGEVLEAVNTGAIEIGLINHYYWVRSEQDPTTLRAQLKFGDPGSVSALVNVTGAGIINTAAESEDARAFVEYLVSSDAQTYFVEETYEYPLAPGLEGPRDVPPLDQLGEPDIDLSQLDSLEQTVQLLTSVGLL